VARRCPQCRAVLPEHVSFCNQCGTRADFARSDVAPPAPAAYTPKHLAEKILTSRAALEGERKQVTVLFADVKGSMELAEQLDPEEWHRIMNRFFTLLTEGIHRFEGTVNQYTGDGIMALFGAPIAHEDHAQRACYAALHLGEELQRYAHELKRTQGVGFAVRMGLNSGEVVVGAIGDDLRMDYTAQGHTVGLAARMEQLADPGKVYLTEHTAKLVGGYFRLRDLGVFTVKGVREPLRVHELEGAGPLRTRLEVTSHMRGLSRFVGRENEMAILETALGRAVAGGGQVVGVVGEAGLGKSRLCGEFAARCRARGVPVHRGHGAAHGKLIPFLPILELFRNYYGITEQDAEQTAREKIAGRLLLLDDGLREALPLVFDFLGVPDPERPAPHMDPEVRQRRLYGVVKRSIQARSRSEPAVLLLEDLHWFDGGSEGFVELLVEAAAEARTLVVLNFRPEYHAAWMERAHYQRLPLDPLGPEAIGGLLEDILGNDPSVAGLPAMIRGRTGGNPFFVEEVVQSLVESGSLAGSKGAYRLTASVDALVVPATVQAVLAARIDRLPEREKRVLQTAAVIGKTFEESILTAVTALPAGELADSLRILGAAEFVYPEALFPEAEYAFKHPLTQEVAYHSQLADRRRRVHAAVAEAMAKLRADKLDERAAVLAYHWEVAGDPLAATRWHRRSAQWTGVSDARVALGHWRKVCELLRAVPESEETRDLGLRARAWILSFGWRLGMSEAEAEECLAEGRDLAARAENPALLALIVQQYAAIRGFTGDLEGYRERSREAVDLADQGGDIALRVGTRVSLALAYYLMGSLGEALAVKERAIELGRGDAKAGGELYGFLPYVFHVLSRGTDLYESGRLEEAQQALDQAAELARTLNDVEGMCWTSNTQSVLAWFRGDARAAIGHASRGLRLAESAGTAFNRVWTYLVLGTAQALDGQWQSARQTLEQSLAITRETRVGTLYDAFTLAELSRAFLGLGDGPRARAIAEQAAAVRDGTRLYAINAYLALAEVLLRIDGAAARDAIERALDTATTLVRETGARGRLPFVIVERAELARLQGDEAGRQRDLREAHRLFIEMGAPLRAAQVAAHLGA
jgi:class 3 adenylate cyclase/tetratricopeptide (TPR) repeat protein